MSRYNDSYFKTRQQYVTDNKLHERIYEKGHKEGFIEAIEIMFYMSAYTMNYKLDFGKKRLQRIMREIYNNIDAFRTGQLEKEDYTTIKNEMIEKYNIEIT